MHTLLYCSYLGAALPLTTVISGDLANVFGGFVVQNPLNLGAITTEDEFNREVVRLVLMFVYIGLGTMVAVYFSSVLWIITGERITRRIRGY